MENNFDSKDYGQRDNNQGERRQRRPRIGKPSGDGYRSNRGSSSNYSTPSYSSRDDRRGENNYRPSNNGYNREYNGDRGYQREGYQNRENNGYRQNDNRPYQREGYQQRENNGYQQRENNGYRRNDNRSYQREGYQQRDNNNGHRQNEGRPYQREGYQNRENNGGYNKGFKNKSFKEGQGNRNPNAKYSQKKQIEYKKQYVDYTQPMRLNKFLANAGICSRREADDYITAGVITVNGEVVSELGYKIIPATDKVMFHDQPVKVEKKVYILLNKPKDCVTTVEDTHDRKTVLDLVKNACSERVYPVGRLDRNTTGVLLITNDGDLTSKLTHPKYDKKKIYQVVLDRDLEDADFEKIVAGITLEDGDIKVDEIAFVKEDDRKTVGVEIHSGRNRIVRRIFDSLGYRVVRLDRVYFAGLTKKNLPRGKWRYLSEMEVNMLKMSAAAMKD